MIKFTRFKKKIKWHGGYCHWGIKMGLHMFCAMTKRGWLVSFFATSPGNSESYVAPGWANSRAILVSTSHPTTAWD